jgi:hypothetical protein
MRSGTARAFLKPTTVAASGSFLFGTAKVTASRSNAMARPSVS